MLARLRLRMVGLIAKNSRRDPSVVRVISSGTATSC